MMYREPSVIPLQAGVFALINRRRRFAYVSYTQNLQKRSHSMSHMLLSQDEDDTSYWPIRELPKHPSDEYVFKVMKTGEVDVHQSFAAVAASQRFFLAKGYRIVSGNRASSPIVTFKGRKMTLADAVKDHSDVKYVTAYRRLERGWSIEQALGIEEPAPRWHRTQQRERKKREAERARAA
jgi:hypothetical protein